jgi:two-component system, OmpR family, phosphate regulon sensor histidine kinase PhoR
MRVRGFFNTAAPVVAIIVILCSTAALSMLSYHYTVGREFLAETTVVQYNIRLANQTIDRIEQKIIDNDRTLSDMVDVEDPSKWAAEVDLIKKNADLNVDQVYILRFGNNYPLFPLYSYAIRNSWGAFKESVKEFNVPKLALNQVHHLHKERANNYFFASYVLKENQKGDKYLICFQLDHDRIMVLLDKYLRGLQKDFYVSIVDYDNNGIYNQPISRSSKYYYETRFPSTLYKWILQAVPRTYTELESEVRNQRRINLFFIILSSTLILVSLAVIYVAARRERQLRTLKEEFISNVSHELKTPLSLIRMFSEILVTGRIKSEGAKHEYYAIIHNESDRMGRLVNNLLDFSNLERDKTRKYFESTDVAGIVNKALEAYRYELQKEGFRLTCYVDPALPLILADPNALSMAFFNLLDNSMKYSGDQKEIAIRIVNREGCIELSVADKGVGIAPGEKQKIFEKFYRGASAQVRNTRGSGIGLAITKQVAEMHGGDVSVESEPGQGSTFTLKLPVRSPQVAVRQESDRTAEFV